MREPQPRCPACRWYLAFVSEDKSWIARCWNPQCSVDVVPPTVNTELLSYVRECGPVLSTTVAEAFGWTVANANNHLTTLRRLCLVKRRSVPPRRGGKRYAWESA